MEQEFMYKVNCPRCGTVLADSFEGSRAYVKCHKCKTKLYYEIDENGVRVKPNNELKDFGKKLAVSF